MPLHVLNHDFIKTCQKVYCLSKRNRSSIGKAIDRKSAQPPILIPNRKTLSFTCQRCLRKLSSPQQQSLLSALHSLEKASIYHRALRSHGAAVITSPERRIYVLWLQPTLTSRHSSTALLPALESLSKVLRP